MLPAAILDETRPSEAYDIPMLPVLLDVTSALAWVGPGRIWAVLAVFALPSLAWAEAAPDSIGRGEQLYAVCAACHGVEGMGQPDGFAPVIAGQHASVLTRQLRDYRDGTRWDPRMEHVAQLRAISRPEDLSAVATYISRLAPIGPASRGSGHHLGSGARVYLDRCADCHGATGQGSAARGVPRLAGQHAAYLQRQVLDAVEGRRPLLRATHGAMFSRLSADSLDGLTDYLALNARRGDGAPR